MIAGKRSPGLTPEDGTRRSAVRFKEVEYENDTGKENRDDPDLH